MATGSVLIDGSLTSVSLDFAGLLATLLLLAKLFSLWPQKATERSNPARVSLLGFFARWLKDRSLTLPDVLYQIGLNSDAPLVQVSLGPSSAYVVRSTELTARVAKMSQHLSMVPFYNLVPMIGGLDRRAAAILRKDMGSRKVPNVFSEMHKAFLQSFIPGSEYNRIISEFTEQFGVNVRGLHREVAGCGTINPYTWLQRAWVNAMGAAAWGQDSPFLDFAVIDDWWTFRESAPHLLFGVTPTIFSADARAAKQARERVIKSFGAYYQKVCSTQDTFDVPQRVLQYVAAGKKWGFNHNDLARLDLSNTFGLFKDPIDAAYGMLAHLCSHPDVLETVRRELEAVLVRSADGKHATLHAHNIRTACPLFTSCFYEALRLTAGGFPARAITSDFDIDGTTFRKGGIVVLAGVPVQRDPANWPDPDTFKPDRFLGVKAPEAEMQKTYRAFGGGAAICGGRHMAPPLVLTAVASLILGFDMEPVEGEWAIPKPEYARVPEAATPPRGVGDPKVVVRPRCGFEGVKWSFCDGCGLAATHRAEELGKS